MMLGVGLFSTRSIVATTFRLHRDDCRFAPGAFERVIAAIETAMGKKPTAECFIETCEQALLAEEIYCPHEKVDNRSEYGGIEGLSPAEVLKEANHDRTPA
jgi:hypothetical protein